MYYLQSIEEMNFRFAEECQPCDNVETLAENMQFYPPEHYLTGADLFYEYKPDVNITKYSLCYFSTSLTEFLLPLLCLSRLGLANSAGLGDRYYKSRRIAGEILQIPQDSVKAIFNLHLLCAGGILKATASSSVLYQQIICSIIFHKDFRFDDR